MKDKPIPYGTQYIDEKDIEEALAKKILTSKEADMLKNTDWESFETEIENDGETIRCLDVEKLTKGQSEIFELCLRFKKELVNSRKVIQLRKH